MKFQRVQLCEMMVHNHNCLNTDVTKGNNMLILINSYGEVLIQIYVINYYINDCINLLNRTNNLKDELLVQNVKYYFKKENKLSKKYKRYDILI